MQGEIWKDVAGYEGVYQVSNMGRVKNVRSKKILCVHDTSNGYHQVHLCKEGKTEYAYVHRIVAKTFHADSFSVDLEVNHIDGNRLNNRADNLEWCTRSENHKTDIYFLRQVQAKVAANKNKPVCQLSEDGAVIAIYHGLHEAFRKTGAQRHCIKKCCEGRTQLAGGYRWQYA